MHCNETQSTSRECPSAENVRRGGCLQSRLDWVVEGLNIPKSSFYAHPSCPSLLLLLSPVLLIFALPPALNAFSGTLSGKTTLSAPPPRRLPTPAAGLARPAATKPKKTRTSSNPPYCSVPQNEIALHLSLRPSPEHTLIQAPPLPIIFWLFQIEKFRIKVSTVYIIGPRNPGGCSSKCP
ncbi:hypothetical protein J3A83DRAFT_2617014 [Scleroderma citrinum]